MQSDYLSTPRHAIAVIGGACAGAEAAEIFAKAGIYTVVIDQNARPFGKIEDGLPRWHNRQRSREYENIAAKLKTEGVQFVPNTTLGSDITLDDLRAWGWSAVVLACGAWDDRKLGVPGADEAEGKGVIYQNPFIFWFNHHEEKSYEGDRYDVVDGAIVVGGGLASIDCVKAINLELTAAALRARGHEVDVIELEHGGIPKSLDAMGVTWEELGLKGCTLVYRRSNREMPLAQFKDGADDASKEKTMQAREKLMDMVAKKYFVNTRFNVLPQEVVLDAEGRVAGLKVISTRTEGRKVIEIEGSQEVLPTQQIVSSIGSIPRPIPGLPLRGEFYEYSDWDLGIVKDLPGVFGVGNVVTGQGNIKISRVHAQAVGSAIIANYLGVGDGDRDAVAVPKGVEAAAAAAAEAITDAVEGQPKLGPAELAKLAQKVKARQGTVGYGGDFDAWIAKVTPPDRQ